MGTSTGSQETLYQHQVCLLRAGFAARNVKMAEFPCLEIPGRRDCAKPALGRISSGMVGGGSSFLQLQSVSFWSRGAGLISGLGMLPLPHPVSRRESPRIALELAGHQLGEKAVIPQPGGTRATNLSLQNGLRDLLSINPRSARQAQGGASASPLRAPSQPRAKLRLAPAGRPLLPSFSIRERAKD